MAMMRGNMSKQITEVPMAGCKPKKGMMGGGMVKPGYKKGGRVKKKGYAKSGSVDQSMCSPRKQMAMGKMR
jgi:hypothetical protein